MQDPKYEFLDGAVRNRHTGEIIPADEPVFLFRARDRYAFSALIDYCSVLLVGPHRDAVQQRVDEFAQWAKDHPERMKEPDTPA